MHIIKRALLLTLVFCVIGLLGFQRLAASLEQGFLKGYFRTQEDTVLFTGDLMLARAVEDRVREVGTDRFFDRVRTLHERARYVVVNFEASIPLVHTRSPDFTFRFSVDPLFAPMLRQAGITHASLANNHAHDFGSTAKQNTEAQLARSSVVPFGTPRSIASSSVTYVSLSNTRVAIVGIEAVFGRVDIDALTREIREAEKSSQFQVAYVHWGDEYQPVHNSAQEALARSLVALGVDAIVGHHPHIVQDIATLDSVPVFYSLGNYVFDQYFDESVTKGLALLMRIKENVLVFELVPVATDKSVPYIEDEAASKRILESIARHSQGTLRSDILRGVVTGKAK